MRKNKLFLAIVACVLLVSTVVLASILVNAADTAKLTVNASNGAVEVYVDGKIKSDGETSAVLNVPVGATVELVAKTGGNQFMFWTDNVMNTVSPVSKEEANKIKVTVTSDATYTAHFAPTDGSVVVYRNTNSTTQVLAVAEYTDANDFTEALVGTASKFGYTFNGWSMDVDAIKAKIGTEKVITVNPVYTATAEYTVSVVGGKITKVSGEAANVTSGTYKINTSITLTADNAGEGYVAWKDSKNNIVALGETLEVSVFEDETYTVEVSATEVEYNPYLKLVLTPVKEGRVDSQLYFSAGSNTLVEYGLIYARDFNCNDDELNLENVDGAKVKKVSYTKNGSALINYFGGVERVSARGYLTYSDGNNTTTIYSNVAWSDVAELLDLKHELRVDENGNFKVVMFSDLQCNTSDPNGTSAASVAFKQSLENIKTIVDREQPDLVVFGGDNSFDVRYKDGNGVYDAEKSEALFREYVGHMVAYIEEKQIPWAHVFGNHDDESEVWAGESVPKDIQHEIYTSFEYCVSKDVEELFGVGNYVLPVLSNDGSKIAFNVWALDSGQYDHVFDSATDNIVFDGNGFYGHYQSMEKNQVDWYADTSDLLAEYNGEKIPAMLYMHIPLQESYFAYKYGTNLTGVKGENISAHPENVGLFSAIMDRGDIKLIAHGHDHKNDFSVDYKGVTFAYTACIGVQEYHDETMVGGRVINFSTKTPDKLETYMSYIIERGPVDPNSPILDLVIDDNGTVSNASTSTYDVVLNEREKGSVSVVKDTDLNKNVLEFTGGGAWQPTTSYSLSTKKGNVDADLVDGFTLEAYIKPTATYSSYVGIVDYEEAGGFGLVIYQGSDATKAKITAEIADHSTDEGGKNWLTLQKEVDLGKWYHVVVVYDGANTATLYINGEVAATGEVVTAMRAPSFNGSDKHICVGSSAQSVGNTSQPQDYCGFTGRLSTCKILRAPVSANDVKVMYEAVKPEEPEVKDTNILRLEIAENGTVSNTSTTGPAISSHNYDGSSKTVVKDDVINRNVITFAPASSGLTSTYIIPSASFNDTLKDGFAYEVFFKPTAAISSGYVGVLDYEEAGGFGLDLYPGSTADKVKISVDFYATSWKAYYTADINLNEWCHVVFSYNGVDKLQIYVNGALVKEETLTNAMALPTFDKRAGEEYICIGACAQAWTNSAKSTGEKGFTGSLAVCNIFYEPVTADAARAMYDAVNPYILKLDIDATNKAVTNAVEGGIALDEVTHANSSKTISTDNTIGKDIVTFSNRGLWATTDAYILESANIGSYIEEGFSAEVYFNVNDTNNLGSSYQGILNFEEGGGFGLDIEPSGNSGKVNLSLEVAYWDSANSKVAWEEIVTEIELQKWVHCVFVYSGPEENKVYMYVNGNLVNGAPKTLPAALQMPTAFGSYTPYITIGACTQTEAGRITQNGFNGSIAVCNIYSTSMSATGVAYLYNACVAK